MSVPKVRVLGAGDNVVDRYVDLGLMFPGGNALNVAVFARRAGAQAAYLGVVGNDEAGRHVLSALVAEDIEIDRVRILPGPNAYSDVRLLDGERVFGEETEGVSRFILHERDIAYAATFDVVHTGACALLETQVPMIATRVSVSFDFSTRREPQYLAPILPHLKFAFFSGGDLSSAEVERLIVEAYAQGPGLVVATCGARGSIGFDGSDLHQQGALPIDPVDTLGAGDAYIGRLLVEHLAGEELARAMELAAKEASVVCAGLGAFGHGARWHRMPPTEFDEISGGTQ
jgi:fructoselysine 6-kinase